MVTERPEDGQSGQSGQPPAVLVVGVGNLLLKDEGIGVHVAKALEEMALPPDVKIIDAGTAPDLIAYTQAGDRIIIVDAARAGGKAGTVYRFRPDDLATPDGGELSLHELGVAQNLRLMSLLGNQPGEIVIIGVEPAEIDWGTELSPGLRAKVPEIVKIVLGEIDKAHPKI